MENRHLIIFIKNPVKGKVKTRLAASIGADKALDIYQHLLSITRQAALVVNCVRQLFYSDGIEQDAWDDDAFNKHVQEGDSLGERMHHSFKQIFALGADRALIIGSDCPEMNTALIEEAFDALDNKDLVIGPAKDGGYYLLGMKKLHSFLFKDKQWSTDTVFEDTVVDLMENRLSYHRLPVLSDLDTIYDLHLLKGQIGS